MEECNLSAKPRPPSSTSAELWTLYFIQHCQLAPAAPDPRRRSSPALYAADAASPWVARFKNHADLTETARLSARRGQHCNEPAADGWVTQTDVF